MGAFLAGTFEALGGTARLHHAETYGDHLQIDFPGREKTKPVLLLGHFDTVYPLGTLANMPCRIADGRMHGPGVLDMKSGIALMLFAIEALQTWNAACPAPSPSSSSPTKKSAALLPAKPPKLSRGNPPPSL